MEVEEGVVNERRERGADADNEWESAVDPDDVEFRLREMLGV